MAGKYCTKCGFANSERRGACLMCYGYLDEPSPSGVVCPNPDCGRDNDRNATFCMHCGTPLAEEVTAVPDSLALAFVILDAAEGTTGTGDERIGPSDAEAPQMDEEQAAAFEEFKAQQTALGDQPAAEPAEDELEEEQYAPPSALTLEHEALSMSEPAEEAQDVSEEELVPPPPMDMEEEQALPMDALSLEPSEPADKPPQQPVQEAATSIPPVPDEITEDDLVPPVPQDLLGPEDTETQPEEQQQATADEPEPDTDKSDAPDTEEEEEGGLGGWSLDFGDEDQEQDK